MSTLRHLDMSDLPGRFADIVHLMPPQAIQDDVHYENTSEVIDRLMTAVKLTKGQALYLETLVQLVQAYEASASRHRHVGISGLDSLKHCWRRTA